MKVVGVASRLILAAVFVSAGVVKIADPAGFAEAIGRFELLGSQAALPVAYYLPWVEVFAGVGLLTPLFFRGAWWLLVVILAVATTALVQAYFRGLAIDCGCWGTWWEMPVEGALLRNTGLFVLLVLVRPVLLPAAGPPPQHPQVAAASAQ